MSLVVVDDAFDQNDGNADKEFDGNDEGDGEDGEDPLQIAQVCLYNAKLTDHSWTDVDEFSQGAE